LQAEVNNFVILSKIKYSFYVKDLVLKKGETFVNGLFFLVFGRPRIKDREKVRILGPLAERVRGIVAIFGGEE